jgi:hypothetical protein
MGPLTIQTGHNSAVRLMGNGEIAILLSQEKIDNIKSSAEFDVVWEWHPV